MSVEELKFSEGGLNWFIINKEKDKFKIKLTDGTCLSWDRNQAHLLMLYLQEHLK